MIAEDRPGSTENNDNGVLTRPRLLALTLIAVTIGVFYLCYALARPFLPALTWGIALAVVANPLHSWLLKRTGRPNVAAALATLLVGIGILVPCTIVVASLVREASTTIQSVQQYIQSGQWRETIDKYPRLSELVQGIEQSGGRSQVEDALSTFSGRMVGAVGGSVWSVLQLLITLFVLFYFFRDRRNALSALRRVVPFSNSETDKLFHRISDTIYATLYGTVVVAMIQGVLGGLMFWWLGLPAPLLWGVVMALLAIIPYLGAFVIWVPAAIYLAAQGDVGKAAILTLWGTVIIGLVDNLVYPLLVGKRLRMHTLAAFIAIVGGIDVFGMSGIVLGPVIMAIGMALVEIWRGRTAGGDAAEAAVA